MESSGRKGCRALRTILDLRSHIIATLGTLYRGVLLRGVVGGGGSELDLGGLVIGLVAEGHAWEHQWHCEGLVRFEQSLRVRLCDGGDACR